MKDGIIKHYCQKKESANRKIKKKQKKENGKPIIACVCRF